MGLPNMNVKEEKPELICEELNSAEKINRIVTLYTGVTKAYTREYQKKYNIDYNKMIKRIVEYDIFDSQRDTCLEMLL